MIVVDPDRVVRNKMTVAPVFAVAVFGSSLAAYSLHFDVSSGAYADLYAPILHECPIYRIVVVAESCDHSQDQVAAASALPEHSTSLVAPGRFPALALEKAGSPGPALWNAARISNHCVKEHGVARAIRNVQPAGGAEPCVSLTR